MTVFKYLSEGHNKYEIYINNATKATGIDPVKFSSEMQNLGAGEISFIPANRLETFRVWANKIDPAFYSRGMDLVNGAMADIERNINPKYIFADLANRFFLTL